jgi:hypothetical protein
VGAGGTEKARGTSVSGGWSRGGLYRVDLKIFLSQITS